MKKCVRKERKEDGRCKEKEGIKKEERRNEGMGEIREKRKQKRWKKRKEEILTETKYNERKERRVNGKEEEHNEINKEANS